MCQRLNGSKGLRKVKLVSLTPARGVFRVSVLGGALCAAGCVWPVVSHAAQQQVPALTDGLVTGSSVPAGRSPVGGSSIEAFGARLLWAAANPVTARGKTSTVATPDFDPLVPDADFGPPLSVTQTQFWVVGPVALKPLQVFHDERNTHILLPDLLERPSVLVPARGGLHPQPSWVQGANLQVRGVHPEIVLAYPDGRYVSLIRLDKSPQQGRRIVAPTIAEGGSGPHPVPDPEQAASLARALGEAERMRADLGQQQKQNTVLQDHLGTLQRQNLDLQRQLDQSHLQQQKAQTKTELVQTQNQDLQAQISNLQGLVSELRQAQAGAPVGAMAAAPGGSVQGWVLQPGETVAGALGRWASSTGRTLNWKLTMDVPIRRIKRYEGSLENALQQLSTDLQKVFPVLIELNASSISVGPSP